MKILKRIAFSIFAVLFMTVSVNAKTVSNWQELKTCLETEGDIECVSQVEITEELADKSRIKVAPGSKRLVLGKKLTVKSYIWANSGARLDVDGDIDADGGYLFYVYPDATLNLNSGKFTSNYDKATSEDPGRLIVIYGGTDESSLPANVNVGEDAELYNGMINITDMSGAAYNVNVDFAGKIVNNTDVNFFVMYVTGNIKTGMPVITIKDGAVINNPIDTAIYEAGNAHLIVEGGQITGTTGIEIRAGKLEVLGGTVTGTAEEFSANPNGNGSTVVGAGIVVSQHTTKLPIDVDIKGGTISGKKSAYLTFLEENPNREVVSLNITGGTFNTNVEEYVSEVGYAVKEMNDKFVVGKENNITINEVTNGKVEASIGKAIVGETVTLTVTPDEGYEVKSVKVVGTSNTEVPVTDNKFIMPNAEVNVTVEFNKISTSTDVPVINITDEVKEVEIGVSDKNETEKVLLESLNGDEKLKDIAKDASVKVSVEIEKMEVAKEVETKIVETVKAKYENIVVSNYFDITVAVKNAKNEELGTISKLTSSIKLMVALPENLKLNEEGKSRNYYVIRQHGEEIEIIDNVKLSEDGKSLIFETDRFSTYAIAYEDVNVTSPKTGDSILTYVAFGSLAIIGITGAVLYIKKKNLFNV